jgi:hypothetical protein
LMPVARHNASRRALFRLAAAHFRPFCGLARRQSRQTQ